MLCQAVLLSICQLTLNLNYPLLPWQVLFVGEALVGNDAVDQLSKFNQRLADLSTAPEPRAIDGILLTKFDTIDDKVRSAGDLEQMVLVAAYVCLQGRAGYQGGFVPCCVCD